MATTESKIPDIAFAFYYPQIIEALLAWKRAYLPELSDESDEEPTIQLLKAFAVVAHQNNVVADLIAQESLLRTARLPESVREHLRLIGYEMEPARPAQVELLMSLTRQFAAPSVIVPLGAQVSTDRDPETNVTIFFEVDAQVSVTATEEFTGVFAVEDGTWTDYTTEANDPTTPAADWSPWADASTAEAIYIGHDSVMFDRVDSFVTTPMTAGVGFGVWEYYNGDFQKAAPTSITQNGNKLLVDLTGYLGPTSRAGSTIRVQLNSTTAFEDAVSFWNGDANVVEVGLLGQSTVSLDPADYTIGSDWDALAVSSSSGTGDLYFGQLDEISYLVPQSTTANWRKTQLVDGGGNPIGSSSYWIRFRWIEAPATVPTMQYVSMSEATQYVLATATQGQTETSELVGSSSGDPNQTFELALPNMILPPVESDTVTEVTVDGSPWTRVENFIESAPTDENFVIQLTGNNDVGQIKFGDGQRGRIPPAGASNIRATYRHGADENGNVGAGTVTKDRTSLNFVNTITNPRQAIGWSAAEGSTEQSLELAKQLGPAVARLKGVAVSADDLVTLTQRYVDSSGASPFSRSVAVEGAFGPNTVELAVLAKGGGLATSEQLDELALFYNGDKNAIPPVKSHFASNQKVVATNCPQRQIDVVAKVKAVGVTEEQIENALRAVLDPEARAADGSWEWEFGEAVERSRLNHEIHRVSKSIVGVELISPAANIKLQGKELPRPGSISIEIVSPNGES
jgi:hypothetical protein